MKFIRQNIVGILALAGAMVLILAVTWPKHHVAPTANNNNAVYQIQANTAAITSSGDGFTVVTNATSMGPGNYTIFFDNEGTAPGFYSFDGVHIAGRFPASTAVSEISVSFTGTWTIYVERVAGGSNLGGLYIWGRYQYYANAMN